MGFGVDGANQEREFYTLALQPPFADAGLLRFNINLDIRQLSHVRRVNHRTLGDKSSRTLAYQYPQE